MWSPMAEISTLFPQLEHLIVGKMPISIIAMMDRRGHGEYSGAQPGVHAAGKNNEKEPGRPKCPKVSTWREVRMAFRGKNRRVHQTLRGVGTICTTNHHTSLHPIADVHGPREGIIPWPFILLHCPDRLWVHVSCQSLYTQKPAHLLTSSKLTPILLVWEITQSLSPGFP